MDPASEELGLGGGTDDMVQMYVREGMVLGTSGGRR